MILKPRTRLAPDVLQALVGLKDEIEPEHPAINMSAGHLVGDRDTPRRRRTEIRWLLPGRCGEIFDFAQSIGDRFSPKVVAHGRVVVEQAILLVTYHPWDFYGWHVDENPDAPGARMLSCSILLSDDFTGGRLEFRSARRVKLEKAGDFVLFDCGEEHRVQPIRSGVRDALVVWWRRRAGP
jgi:hypothetical protein